MYSKETLAFMEAAVDAVVVIDHRGKMLAVNDATSRMFGFPTDELIGHNVSVLMPEPDRSQHNGYLRRYLDTGNAKIIGIGRQVSALRRDGSIFPARLSVGRVPDTDPPRFVGMLRDITAELEATAALKLERDRANAYLELHDSILLRLDPAHRVREINARGADLLGAPREEIHGYDWLDFMNGDAERERARNMLASARSGRGAREREFDVLDFSRTRLRIYWRCIALQASDGTPSGWLISGTDVTERTRREEQAAMAKERLTRVARLASMGEMASGVAHELNQPLTAITTYARACERFLAMERPDVAEVRDAVREIGAEGLRAARIIERLRQLVRNDEPAEQVTLDLNAIVEDLRAFLDADAREFGIRLEFELATGLPAIQGDAAQLQQVILNLARNAFEAIDESGSTAGEVRLTTAATATGDVELRIRDNGPGFAPEISDRLFHPFATTRKSGTGLGLAVSRTIIQAHRGHIEIGAATPRGASVFVRLPASEVNA